MIDDPAHGWNRRDLLQGATLLALALGVPVAAVSLSGLSSDDLPSDRQRALIREVSQLAIPRTGTPGAGEVGVGDFVILALAHGIDGARAPVASAAAPAYARHLRRDGSLKFLDWLEHDLDHRGRGEFLSRPIAERRERLAQLDAEAFAAKTDMHPWKTVKALILDGYYTSEVGGAKELNYELVPGRWDPDLPLEPGARAWSSDWTAVDFG